MKVGDRVKIVTSSSSFCGELGTVVTVSQREVDVRLDSQDIDLFFYVFEVEIV